MPVPLLDVSMLLPELDDGHQGEGYGDGRAQGWWRHFADVVRARGGALPARQADGAEGQLLVLSATANCALFFACAGQLQQ